MFFAKAPNDRLADTRVVRPISMELTLIVPWGGSPAVRGNLSYANLGINVLAVVQRSNVCSAPLKPVSDGLR